MNKARPKQSGPYHFYSKYRAKAWQCGARAQVVSDLQQRAELLRLAGMWLSLTEPTEDDLRGAYEVPAITATGA
jgi:hypothetical protein